jgi:GNAT superfamily N-acetyltransferase
MQIRPAIESDIPAIVELLKTSLGESLMPKSVAYWRWKHTENPFGPSAVLLYWDNEVLAGVRAFMRWEWTKEQKVYHALRAVDTATHPQYQGKGIFKKLTLSLVEECKLNGDHFIFNTPNEQSKPGYLKMGWQECGKLPITMSIQRPFRMFKKALKGESTELPKPIDNKIAYYLNHPSLSLLLKSSLNLNRMTTNVSVPYLKWRYNDVPVVDYVVLGEEEEDLLTGLMIGRIKQSKLGIELRITDCFLKSKQAEKALISKIKTKKRDWGIDYCTVSGLGQDYIKRITGEYRMNLPVGPAVTIRPLNLTDLDILQNFRRWSPSIGDLELF